MNENELSNVILSAAIEVHRTLGPGLLESIYEECLAVELGLRGIGLERQRRVCVLYKGRPIAIDLRLDMLVDQQVVLELKSVEKILPVHRAQLLSHPRLTGKSLGLLINFNVPLLRDGVRRVVNNCADLRVFASSR